MSLRATPGWLAMTITRILLFTQNSSNLDLLPKIRILHNQLHFELLHHVIFEELHQL